MLDVGGTDLFHTRPQHEQVVVFGGSVVLAGGVGHHHEQAGVLEGPVGVAMGPQHLRAAHLEIGEIIGVMDPSLTVGLLIPNADLHLVDWCGHRSIQLPAMGWCVGGLR